MTESFDGAFARAFVAPPFALATPPRAATSSTHSSATSWHSPSSVFGARRGNPPAMRMYACVHSCAKTAPNATKGRPYRTTTALTTVSPNRGAPTARSAKPTGKKPPFPIRALPTRSTVRMMCSVNRHRPRVRLVRPTCHASLPFAASSASWDTKCRGGRWRHSRSFVSFFPARAPSSYAFATPSTPPFTSGSPSSAMNWHTPSYTGVESRSVSTTAVDAHSRHRLRPSGNAANDAPSDAAFLGSIRSHPSHFFVPSRSCFGQYVASHQYGCEIHRTTPPLDFEKYEYESCPSNGISSKHTEHRGWNRSR